MQYFCYHFLCAILTRNSFHACHISTLLSTKQVFSFYVIGVGNILFTWKKIHGIQMFFVRYKMLFVFFLVRLECANWLCWNKKNQQYNFISNRDIYIYRVLLKIISNWIHILYNIRYCYVGKYLWRITPCIP